MSTPSSARAPSMKEVSACWWIPPSWSRKPLHLAFTMRVYRYIFDRLTACVKKRKVSLKLRQRTRRSTLKALRRARADAGLTISELATRAGVSRDTISKAERGLHSLQASTLHKVAQALGRTPSELLAEEEKLAPKVESRSLLQASFNDALEDAAQSEASQEALAVLFQGLTRRGQGIVEQSLREGPSEVLSRELAEYHAETAALYQIKGRRDIFGRGSDEVAEAEAAYQEVEDRIQAMLRQDIDATEEERSAARRFKGTSKSHVSEEHEADAS
jgi:transcriptional regulator with XRE-family HTH domain